MNKRRVVDTQEFRNRWKSGERAKDIAKSYGMSRAWVCANAKRIGLPTRAIGRKRVNRYPIIKLLEENKNMTLSELRVLAKTSWKTILEVASDIGDSRCLTATEPADGLDVRIYWSDRFNRWMVSTLDDDGWRVKCRAESVFLRNVEFRVSESGRNRYLRTGESKPHAYIYGRTTRPDLDVLDRSVCVSYDPSTDAAFMAHSGYPVYKAECAVLSPLGEIACTTESIKYDRDPVVPAQDRS